MGISDNEKAAILAQALPYIQRYRGKTVVVKYGGAAMVNESLRAAVAEDLVLMSCVGIRTVLVHGGGPEIDAMLRRLGKEPRFVGGPALHRRGDDGSRADGPRGQGQQGPRRPPPARGRPALGLCGLDGGLLARRAADQIAPTAARSTWASSARSRRSTRSILRSALDEGLHPRRRDGSRRDRRATPIRTT